MESARLPHRPETFCWTRAQHHQGTRGDGHGAHCSNFERRGRRDVQSSWVGRGTRTHSSKPPYPMVWGSIQGSRDGFAN